MPRMSRREMNEMAEDREKSAARSDANAVSAAAAAHDPTRSPAMRRQAKATASIARNHAIEKREEAAAYRAGRIPGQDW